VGQIRKAVKVFSSLRIKRHLFGY